MSGTTYRRPPTAQESVLAELRRAIAAGDLAPGEQVRQDALAAGYGVSRVPVREALKILEGEGQVTYHPHRGYFVTALSAEDLVEVYRIRDLLEAEAVRVAVPRMTDDDRAAFAQAAADCEAANAADDLTAMAAANRRFHFLLIGAAAMPRLERLIRQLWDATDAYRSVYYNDPAHRAHVTDEHRAIVAAVDAGDAETTVALLAQHRAAAVRRLSVLLGRDAQPFAAN